MKATSIILGACALGIIAGAAGGTSINTRPIANAADTFASIPDAPIVRFAGAQQTEALPNHYPMTTPEGTIPVEELAYRGRYRDTARYMDAYYVPAEEARFENYEDWEAQSNDEHRYRPATTAHVQPQMEPVEVALADTEALPLPQPIDSNDVSSMTIGGARVVDVSAELAKID